MTKMKKQTNNMKKKLIVVPKKKGLTMLIDGSNLAYRAFHKFGSIRTPQHGHVGLIYGFLKILHSYVVRFQPTAVIVSFDTPASKKSNFRLKLYPEYKASRGKKDLSFDYESFNRQIDVTKKVLLNLGIDVISDDKGLGHETDDYLAYLALKAKTKVLIVSSDKDFIQLLDKSIKLFNPFKETIIRHNTCENIVGFKPAAHKEYLMLTGDTSDNIPGYKGIGPVKATEFIKRYGSLENFLNDKKASFPRVTKEGIEFLYNRNRPLIDLFYALEKYPITKVPMIKGEFNNKTLIKILGEYSMATMLKSEFIKPFKDLQ